MKPFIICHMMESVDGRIDCAMTEQIEPSNVYYDALEELDCPTTLEGRVTMQIHFAESEPFVAKDSTPIGKTTFHKASLQISDEIVISQNHKTGYAVAIDTMGRLKWPSNVHNGKPLLVITSEACAKEYLDACTTQGISWIAVGEKRIDFVKAVDMLNTEFGVKRMAVVGGGHINGTFLEAGLLDEVSVMIGPGIDGRKGMTSVFDGIKNIDRPATLLKLNNVKRMGDTVWLIYSFK